MRNTIIGLVVLLALLAPDRARAQTDLREQLALSYLRLELALADAPPLPAPERARINREFDRTTLLFFAGNMTSALGVIDSLVASLPGAPGFDEVSGSALDRRARSQLAALSDERRTTRIGERDVAFLISVPGDVARRPPAGWPVVVAVHGAGGDERMFFGGYGAGRIRTLADSLGIAVVTPAAPITPAAIFALVDSLAPQHALDAGRVALLGHSMGAGIVAATASQQAQRTRAVACVAGSCAAAAGAGEAVPVTVVAGAIDPLFNVTMLEQQTDALRTGTREVHFRRMDNEGHTLVVGESLLEVMRWLADRLRLLPILPHGAQSQSGPQRDAGSAEARTRAEQPSLLGAGGALDRSAFGKYVDDMVEAQRRAFDLPGGVVVVVHRGEVLHSRGYGYADMEAGRRFDSRTVFRTASVSKLFTAVAVMQLVEQGLIDLDADVSAYVDIPMLTTFPAPVTMRHLLTHTAGFDDRMLGASASRHRPGDVLRIRDFLTSRDAAPRVRPPGQLISYSNHGMTLAGYVVERVSGQSFIARLQRRQSRDHAILPRKAHAALL